MQPLKKFSPELQNKIIEAGKCMLRNENPPIANLILQFAPKAKRS